jgi:hypothetical protein
VWIDPEMESKSINQLMTDFVIDAIMAKRNIGTHKEMARHHGLLASGQDLSLDGMSIML